LSLVKNAIIVGLKHATSTHMIADTRRVSSNILNMFNNSLRVPATQHGRTTHTSRSQQVSYERNSNLTRTTISRDGV